MKDFQRSKVYAWENEEYMWDDQLLSLEECQKLVNENFMIDRVLVTDGRGRRSACAAINKMEIRLPRSSRKKWIVLHEIAHFFGMDNHGPKFMKAYIKLLSKYYNRSEDSLKASALDRGVQVA